MKFDQDVHGLRGVCCLSVFAFHVGGPEWMSHGVDAFFIISGYIVPRTALGRDPGQFLWDRVCRIYPAFLAIHLVVFLLGPAIDYKGLASGGISSWAGRFVSDALLLPGVFPLEPSQVVAWSLSFEALFYLVITCYLWVSRRAGPSCALVVLAPVVCYELWVHPRCWLFVIGALLGWTEWVPVRSWLLRTWPLSVMGSLSYSFYLWHTVVMYPMKRLEPSIGYAGYVALTLVATLWVSWASYHALEVWTTRRLKAWRTSKGTQPGSRSLASAP